METTPRKGNAVNEWRLTQTEETAWYEAGLSADGVKLDWYEKDSIILYGRILLETEMKAAIKERDEARAEVETLKQALHDARLENSGQAAQLERTRPEPSRLEIAAMLKAGWINPDPKYPDNDPYWWLQQADELIAAAKEGK
jgi:hypothetical protein